MVPALTTALGRRQVVRHWILIPAFEGSIPSAPATQFLLGRGCAKHGIFSRAFGPLARRLFRRSIKGGSQARATGRLWRPVSGRRKSISAFAAVIEPETGLKGVETRF
jgi:hypothetical protein